MYHRFLIHSFDKRGRSIQWSKNTLFNKWCWEIWTDTCKKMQWDHQLIPYTKINSRWIKDLNVSCDTVKVLEENTGSETSHILCSHIFASASRRAREVKERINKWDYIKLKTSAWLKKPSSKWKGNQPYGKTYLPMILQTRFWFLKYIKNSHDSTPGRQTSNKKKMGKGAEQTLLQGHTEGP